MKKTLHALVPLVLGLIVIMASISFPIVWLRTVILVVGCGAVIYEWTTDPREEMK